MPALEILKQRRRKELAFALDLTKEVTSTKLRRELHKLR